MKVSEPNGNGQILVCKDIGFIAAIPPSSRSSPQGVHLGHGVQQMRGQVRRK